MRLLRLWKSDTFYIFSLILGRLHVVIGTGRAMWLLDIAFAYFFWSRCDDWGSHGRRRGRSYAEWSLHLQVFFLRIFRHSKGFRPVWQDFHQPSEVRYTWILHFPCAGQAGVTLSQTDQRSKTRFQSEMSFNAYRTSHYDEAKVLENPGRLSREVPSDPVLAGRPTLFYLGVWH